MHNIDRTLKIAEPNHIPKRTHLSSQSLSLIGIPKKFHKTTLEDYIANSDALKELKNFIADYLDSINERKDYIDGLFFYGSNGVGKTMLSSIILKTAYVNRYTCKRTTFIKYVDSYTSSWSNDKKTNTFWEECKSAQFLCLEEVGKEIDSKITKPILEDLLRYREEKGYVTIMCTNLTPKDLEELYGASIMSLIKGNTTPIKIVGKDRR